MIVVISPAARLLINLVQVKSQLMFYGFQATALVWAVAVVLRTINLGWDPFAGLGLGMFGALPVSFLGIRIRSKNAALTLGSNP